MAVDFEAIWHTHKRFILQVAAGRWPSRCCSAGGSIAAEATRMAKANAGQQAELQDDLGGPRRRGLEKGRAAALGERLGAGRARRAPVAPRRGLRPAEGEKSGLIYYPTCQPGGQGRRRQRRRVETRRCRRRRRRWGS
ncbi:MAG: hypothetical protein KIT58_02135 [Planctomycetota bacterium]|nr:hypothetical protein [Planctomycetota bacterium]